MRDNNGKKANEGEFQKVETSQYFSIWKPQGDQLWAKYSLYFFVINLFIEGFAKAILVWSWRSKPNYMGSTNKCKVKKKHRGGDSLKIFNLKGKRESHK